MKKTNKQVQEDIMKEYVLQINKKVTKNSRKIKKAIEPILFDAVLDCPEMESVRSGTLKYDLGLTIDPSRDIAEAVAKSTQIITRKFTYTAGAIRGGTSVKIQPKTYLNILSLPKSVVITEKGAVLPWADWMINYGDSIIISDFGVKYTDAGRTGGAIMVQGSRVFRIDPTYSGTEEDNFISRALNTRIPDIESRIWQIILS